MSDAKELEVVREKNIQSHNRFIELAIEKNCSVEHMERLFALKKDYEADEARKAYSRSMVLVQKNMPCVKKALKNDQTHSSYASLDEIICKTKEVYTEQGFSIMFYEGDTTKEEHIRVHADVVHSDGHKETYHYDMPLDGKGIRGNANMTAIHGKSSSVSYGRRYLMCMIFNIPTGDDDDGNKATAVAYIDDKQLGTILDYVADKNVNVPAFLNYIKAEKLETITKADYIKALNFLKVKK